MLAGEACTARRALIGMRRPMGCGASSMKAVRARVWTLLSALFGLDFEVTCNSCDRQASEFLRENLQKWSIWSFLFHFGF